VSFIFNDSIDLGDPFDVFAAFWHYAMLDDGESYGELFYVTQTNEEPISPEYVAKVAEQAQAFFETYGNQLDDHERWILRQLTLPRPTTAALATEQDPAAVRSMARRLKR
jgi:hypothetical protein